MKPDPLPSTAISPSVIGPAGRPLPTDPDALLYPTEAAYLMALSERTLEGLRVRGGGPAFCRLQRSVRYRRGDVVAWVASRRLSSTSEATARHD